MSHNKSRQMMEAVRILDKVFWIDHKDPHALPGAALRHVRTAKKILLREIRKRREARSRERDLS